MNTTFYFLCKVAGGLVIFEVQRSARSEARKEEKRRQEIEVTVLNLFNFCNHVTYGRGTQKISGKNQKEKSSDIASILLSLGRQENSETYPCSFIILQNCRERKKLFYLFIFSFGFQN